MKHQKITAALLTGALALSLAACGGAPQSGAASSSSGSTSQPADAPAQETILFGQVQEIVGNEVTLLLAKEPEAEAPPESEDGGRVTMDAVEMVPATEAGAATEGGVPPAQQIEYTGETVTVTLPAGLKILDSTGQETTLSALAKGSLITLGVDGKDTLNPTFLNILAFANG